MLEQRCLRFDPFMRLPAHHSSDGSLYIRRDLVTRQGGEKRQGHRSIIVVAKCALQSRQTFEVWYRWPNLPMQSLKELCGVTQLLESNSELVGWWRDPGGRF